MIKEQKKIFKDIYKENERKIEEDPSEKYFF